MSATDGEMIEIVEGFRDGILEGGSSSMRCAMVCYPLQSYLSALCGIETTLMVTPSVRCDFGETDHMWLRLKDGRVLDPTADQFNTRRKQYPKVYLGKPTRLHKQATQFLESPQQ